MKAEVMRAEPTSVGEAPRGMCALGTRLAAELNDGQRNLLVSPLSVALALGIIRNGVTGPAARQLDDVLGVDGLESLNETYNTVAQVVTGRSGEFDDIRSQGSVAVELADQVFAALGTPFQPPFLERIARWHGAGVDLVDFAGDPTAAAAAINSWCAHQTHDRITSIVPASGLDPATPLVLANALYFKASWRDPMSPQATRNQSFTTGLASTVSVPMMSAHPDCWTSGETWQATRVVYSGGSLAMALVLPNEGTSVTQVLQSWGSEGLVGALGEWTSHPVRLAWPKWESTWGAEDLAPCLEALGLVAIFDASPAAFDAMSTSSGIFVGPVLHKTWIRVDEKGTEAAAVTGIVAAGGAANPQPKTMVLDRPFIYLVYDVETLTPLFLGVVNDPRASG